jgi:esterase/lipase superfamily enzyme
VQAVRPAACSVELAPTLWNRQADRMLTYRIGHALEIHVQLVGPPGLRLQVGLNPGSSLRVLPDVVSETIVSLTVPQADEGSYALHCKVFGREQGAEHFEVRVTASQRSGEASEVWRSWARPDSAFYVFELRGSQPGPVVVPESQRPGKRSKPSRGSSGPARTGEVSREDLAVRTRKPRKRDQNERPPRPAPPSGASEPDFDPIGGLIGSLVGGLVGGVLGTVSGASSLARGFRGEYTVWFGTNRAPIRRGAQIIGFSSERESRADARYVGACRVWIPESHQMGSLGSPFWKRALTLTDDRLTLRNLEVLAEDAYWAQLRAALASVDAKGDCNAVLFIHGYNVSFNDAALRAAQLGADLDVGGVMTFYSWPSQGALKDYPADAASVEAATPHIIAFLSDLVAKSGATRVHVIAHSMGNRALLRALERLSRATDAAAGIRLNQIILAAPDVDVDTFRDLADAYRRTARRTTLYVSTKDRALRASYRLHRFPRVGLMPPICRVPGIDTVNVQNVDLSFLGHGYVAEAREVLSDMHALLRHDHPPERRFGLRAMVDELGQYWVVKA